MHHAVAVAAQEIKAPSRTDHRDAVPQGIGDSHITGLVEIPALHLKAPITDGIGRIDLIEGVGHIPGTAVPGGLGTMAIAGHRDTFFRGLQKVSTGMIVRIGDGSATYVYQVDSTRVIKPEDVNVLDIGLQPSLVLITCYPLHYLGAAPERFVVHARLLSLTPVS